LEIDIEFDDDEYSNETEKYKDQRDNVNSFSKDQMILLDDL